MLSIESVTVRFDGRAAVDNLSFEVGDGEIVVLLGPSGCGKSTLLRSIAGLQSLDAGRVVRDGEDLVKLAPDERGIGMMFQDHALFPHRDVGRNVEFGLRMSGVGPVERSGRVAEMLKLVGLTGFERRSVGNLSGGEAQRAALARALAPAPSLLLLDEPLGSLDRELRDRLVDDLPRLLRRVGISAIHVTHDHDEAFAVAEKLVVMGKGRVLRIGSPIDVWSDPRHETVARFLGHRNIVDVGERGTVPWGNVQSGPGRIVILPDAATVITAATAGGDERERRADGDGESASRIEARVIGSRFRGALWEVELETIPGDASLFFVLVDDLVPGQRISLSINRSGLRALDSSPSPR